jgi:hypothetical protein
MWFLLCCVVLPWLGFGENINHPECQLIIFKLQKSNFADFKIFAVMWMSCQFFCVVTPDHWIFGFQCFEVHMTLEDETTRLSLKCWEPDAQSFHATSHKK